MPIRLLLIASILCIATYGCETTPTEPEAPAQARGETSYRTGSRLPSSSSSVMGVSKEEWEDSRRTLPGSTGSWK
jgi:hypothetical protein